MALSFNRSPFLQFLLHQFQMAARDILIKYSSDHNILRLKSFRGHRGPSTNPKTWLEVKADWTLDLVCLLSHLPLFPFHTSRWSPAELALIPRTCLPLLLCLLFLFLLHTLPSHVDILPAAMKSSVTCLGADLYTSLLNSLFSAFMFEISCDGSI